MEGWNGYLGIGARLEVHVLARRQLDLELFDEGGHVAVGDDGALVFLHVEDGLGQLDGDVLPDLGLAAQAPAFGYLFAGEETPFGGQDASTALLHLAAALPAAALAATGRGKMDTLLGEGGDQAAAALHFEDAVAVDGDFRLAAADELVAQHQQQRHQQQYHCEENYSCYNYCLDHRKLNLKLSL